MGGCIGATGGPYDGGGGGPYDGGASEAETTAAARPRAATAKCILTVRRSGRRVSFVLAWVITSEYGRDRSGGCCLRRSEGEMEVSEEGESRDGASCGRRR